MDRIKQARDDTSIQGLLLQVDGLGVGWGKVDELRRAIADFRKAGKKVYAYLEAGDSHDYLAAAACDRIFMPESGALMLTGIRDILGADSQEWIGAKQGTFQKLLQTDQKSWQPQETKKRILDFVDGPGKENAIAMYSPQERVAMRQFAQTLGHFDVMRTGGGSMGQQLSQMATQALGEQFMKSLGTAGKLMQMGGGRIISCLARNASQLSPRCRAAMDEARN